ncbi:hypothetical protein ACHAWF_015017 [Thalassiosira exigua]
MQVFALPEVEYVGEEGSKEDGGASSAEVSAERAADGAVVPEEADDEAHREGVFWFVVPAPPQDRPLPSSSASSAPPIPISPSRDSLASSNLSRFVSSTTCSICIEEFEPGERLRVLPRCDHLFHTECILPWLTERQGEFGCRGSRGREWRCPGDFVFVSPSMPRVEFTFFANHALFSPLLRCPAVLRRGQDAAPTARFPSSPMRSSASAALDVAPRRDRRRGARRPTGGGASLNRDRRRDRPLPLWHPRWKGATAATTEPTCRIPPRCRSRASTAYRTAGAPWSPTPRTTRERTSRMQRGRPSCRCCEPSLRTPRLRGRPAS